MANTANKLNSNMLDKVTGGYVDAFLNNKIDIKEFANVLKTMSQDDMSKFLQDYCINKKYLNVGAMKTTFINFVGGYYDMVAETIATPAVCNDEVLEYLKTKFGDSILKGE